MSSFILDLPEGATVADVAKQFNHLIALGFGGLKTTMSIGEGNNEPVNTIFVDEKKGVVSIHSW